MTAKRHRISSIRSCVAGCVLAALALAGGTHAAAASDIDAIHNNAPSITSVEVNYLEQRGITKAQLVIEYEIPGGIPTHLLTGGQVQIHFPDGTRRDTTFAASGSGTGSFSLVIHSTGSHTVEVRLRYSVTVPGRGTATMHGPWSNQYNVQV